MLESLQLSQTERFQAMGVRHIKRIADKYPLPPDVARSIEVLGQVLPFRVNEYVLKHLIDWTDLENDPLFHLTFPQTGMLPEQDVQAVGAALDGGDRKELAAAVAEVRRRLNPHPSGQMEHNVPEYEGEKLPGLQHKYDTTVLYFPSQGQTCHAYCTYCFRWAQFVGEKDWKFAAQNPEQLVAYLAEHPEVTDVLVTGGDPMIMSTERLRQHLEPVLQVPTVQTIRIGTKSLAYWPDRYVGDADADDLLRLLEDIVASGRTAAVMAHMSHPRELDPPVVTEAIRRIKSTGAVLYAQAPLIRRVNDNSAAWAELWRRELALGVVPYYMFVERDTGPHEWFKVPLARALEVFQGAYRELPGLAKTVRGPVMSATPGKVCLDGVLGSDDTPGGVGKVFQARLVQARDRSLVGRPFWLEYDAEASWLNEMRVHPFTPQDITDAVRPHAAG